MFVPIVVVLCFVCLLHVHGRRRLRDLAGCWLRVLGLHDLLERSLLQLATGLLERHGLRRTGSAAGHAEAVQRRLAQRRLTLGQQQRNGHHAALSAGALDVHGGLRKKKETTKRDKTNKNKTHEQDNHALCSAPAPPPLSL